MDELNTKISSANAPVKKRETIRSIVSFVILALVLRAGLVEAFKIPSSSMESTLLIGDHILVNKLAYGPRILELAFQKLTPFIWMTPSRLDIVVFTLPDDPTTEEDESETNIIKRVVGLPGDEIEVRKTTVYINGKALSPEPYAQWLRGGIKDFPEVLDEEDDELRVKPGTKTFKIPEDKVFLMGDNRDHSRDARFWNEHFLDIHRIKGRAFIIYWSQHWERILRILR